MHYSLSKSTCFARNGVPEKPLNLSLTGLFQMGALNTKGSTIMVLCGNNISNILLVNHTY